MEICLIREVLAFLQTIIMGRKYIPVTNISLVQQKIRLEQLFPELIEKCEIKRSELLCVMRLQPAEDTAVYQVLIKYKPTDARPKAWMLSPELRLFNGKKPHHIYGLDEKGCPELCVFYPGYKEWTKQMFIAESFVPWIATWLNTYEYWLITGTWNYDESPRTKGRVR